MRKIAAPNAPPIETVSITYNTPYNYGFATYDAATMEVLSVVNPKDHGGTIRANRAKLRKWLSTDLDVKWGLTFETYDIIEDRRVKAIFSNGTTAIGDVLVGADGVASHGESKYNIMVAPLQIAI